MNADDIKQLIPAPAGTRIVYVKKMREGALDEISYTLPVIAWALTDEPSGPNTTEATLWPFTNDEGCIEITKEFDVVLHPGDDIGDFEYDIREQAKWKYLLTQRAAAGETPVPNLEATA